jgi:2-polyprenyl-6-methoxyphenol hydroxylase-like FAD-dependent oxidoreductase
MRILVVGAGPTGLLAGAGLAARGHQVLTVDRDAGPPAHGTWQRRGVMQFAHAHGFRAQVADVLRSRWPSAHRAWLGAGAEPQMIDTPAGPLPGGTFSRRVTFERSLRAAATTTERLQVVQGHVDGLVERGGRVVAARVDGALVETDLVLDASGRSGRLGRTPALVGGDTGIAYVNRTYRLHPGAARGPMSSPIAWFGAFDGYAAIVFPHERGHFTVVVVRPTADPALRDLRHDAAFDAAVQAIPALAAWTDPARSAPTSPTMAGGALRNTYHPQRGLPGLLAVGDAVTTTAPTAGRGVAMAFMQVDQVMRLLDAGADPVTVAEPFGAWCDEQMLPWVVDHVTMDEAAALRWQGQDVDLTRPLPSDLVVTAAEVEPRLRELTMPYLSMTALRPTLAAAQPLARQVYQTGWRPPHAAGPTREQLVEIISAAHSAAA